MTCQISILISRICLLCTNAKFEQSDFSPTDPAGLGKLLKALTAYMDLSKTFFQDFKPRIHVSESDFQDITDFGGLLNSDGTVSVRFVLYIRSIICDRCHHPLCLCSI